MILYPTNCIILSFFCLCILLLQTFCLSCYFSYIRKQVKMIRYWDQKTSAWKYLREERAREYECGDISVGGKCSWNAVNPWSLMFSAWLWNEWKVPINHERDWVVVWTIIANRCQRQRPRFNTCHQKMQVVPTNCTSPSDSGKNF